MTRLISIFALCVSFSTAMAQTTTISLSSSDFTVSPIFSDIRDFTITIEIDQALQAGVYDDPPLVSVDYQVTGTLANGTPSGFTAFDLQRTIAGADFYTQGSSIQFEVSATADLQDGIQVSELVGTGVVFTFDGREIDNGRFHPAILTLSADGTARIQNSNNIVTQSPLNEVMPGEEYITDLSYLTAELTLLDTTDTTPPAPIPPLTPVIGDGSGAFGFGMLGLFAALIGLRRRNTVVR